MHVFHSVRTEQARSHAHKILGTCDKDKLALEALSAQTTTNVRGTRETALQVKALVTKPELDP